MRPLRSLTLLALLAASFTLILLFQTAYAQDGPFNQGIVDAEKVAEGGGLSTKSDIFPIIASIIQFLLALSAILAMGVIVWGGIMYIMSLGDESKAEKAKTIIKYAIYGVIVVLLSYVIVAFIKNELTQVSSLLNIPIAHAQGAPPPPAPGSGQGFNLGLSWITNKIEPGASGLATDTNIVNVILRIVNFLLGLVAVLALAVLVWGALSYILSLGDESKTEKAKKTIFFALLGVILAGASFVILNVVKNLFVGPPGP
jgi:uncharacterized membrane protein